ncbi:hypothetical protein OKW21_000767 [Catalinimonas alkaloidigena]|uniref:DUF4249 family protein n=1 Tax=Catalinimonas alkaloidigena TaxID=1075417 RepID=UPI002404F43A|nr:DUF4249 family protein [Catalinimonas alkaloidigena]MDF9795504.1 hypothetical protein [Catalinimonas alkaloidigena]
MKNRLAYLIILLISLGACQEVIDYELPVNEAQLVIEGNLTYWADAPERNEVSVTVSQSGNYYDQDVFKPVNDASVQIDDLTNGITYDLFSIEDQKGVYQNLTIPLALEDTYRLRVSYNGNEYESTGTILPVAELDSFSYRYREETAFLEEGYYFFFSGRTPKERGINYYRFKIYEDDSLYNERGDYLIQSDEFLRAEIDTLQLANYAFEVGDSVRIEMYSLEKKIFRYYNELLELLFNDGGLFSSPPSNPTTNIVNKTNPDQPPLGFFQVSSALGGGATIEEEEEN